MSTKNQQIVSAFSRVVRKNPAAAAVLALVVVVVLLVFSFLPGAQPADSTSSEQSSSVSASPDSPASAFEGTLQEAVVTHVVDGDTIKVKLLDDTANYVRLVGIDTPESVAKNQSRNCEEGVIASNYTKTLVAPGQTIWLQRDVSDTDKYGRLLRYVWLQQPNDPANADEIASKMLNAILVREGYAQVKHYAPDTTLHDFFLALGSEALAEHKGVTRKWA